jgi:hypothetical protein
LAELAKPERILEIKREHNKRVERLRARRPKNPLRENTEPMDMDELYGQGKTCIACHK